MVYFWDENHAFGDAKSTINHLFVSQLDFATTDPSLTAQDLYSQNGIPSGPGDVDLILLETIVIVSALNGQNVATSQSPKELGTIPNYCSE